MRHSVALRVHAHIAARRGRRHAGLGAALSAMALLGALIPITAAHASTFTVTSTSDLTASNPTCASPCSLRQAIDDADAAGGVNTITFDSSINGTPIVLTGTNGPLQVTDSSGQVLSIDGNGASSTIVSGGSATEVMSVAAGANVLMTGVTVEDGSLSASSAAGGAISNNGTLTVNSSTVSASRTLGTSSHGGGIYNDGILTLSLDTLSSDQATGTGAQGGAIYNDTAGQLTVTSSTLSSDSSTAGGAGIASVGTATVADDTLSSDTAGGAGGGIDTGVGVTKIIGSTLSGDTGEDGGGLAAISGTVSVVNSTFGSDEATGGTGFGEGGAIIELNATLTVTSATLSGNGAVHGGGGIYDAGGGTVTVTDTIIAHSTGNDCAGAGTLTDGGHNLTDDTSCHLSAGTGDVSGNPDLGTLTNNGGPTDTFALLAGSPAISTGGTCPSVDGGEDQRGVARKTPCDIGAYETPAYFSTTVEATTVVVGTVLNDSATLFGLVNPVTTEPGEGTITFNLYSPSASSCTGTPAYTQTLTADANGTYTTTPGSAATAVGTWRWTALYSGDAHNPAATSGCTLEPVTVTQVTPTLTTSPQPPSTTLGNAINDQATLSGMYPAATAGGTVTFDLYSPSAPNCTGTPMSTQTVAVDGDGTYSSTIGQAADTLGVWNWIAVYSGDTDNAEVTTTCQNEAVQVTQAVPAISTSPQPSSTLVGGTLNDQATLSGLFQPTGTGTLLFSLYSPAVPTCSGAPSFTQTVTGISSNGTYSTTGGFAANAAGTWHWVASYFGDANNTGATSSCSSEAVTVTQSTPTFSTSPQPATAAAGTQLEDQATLSGLESPVTTGAGAGTITFNLYPPSAATCTGSATFTDTIIASNGNGTYTTTGGPTAGTAGTWHWTALYSGDANNAPATSVCSAEPVTVSATAPTFTTSPQPASTTVGTTLEDQATISGLVSPVTTGPGAGTITFNLYPPSAATCTGTAAFTQQVTASSGNGSYTTTGGLAANAAGTWHWTATYSGDANNGTASSGCSAEPVTVGQSTPSLSTSPQPASGPLGTTLEDQAALFSLVDPVTTGPGAGTITFKVFAPSDTSCSSAVFTQTLTASSGDGFYTTTGGPAAGTSGNWHWTAVYSGDANNLGASSGCGTETVAVGQASPGLTTSPQPASTTVGSVLEDQATLSGLVNGVVGPGAGTIVFNLYGPGDTSCTSSLFTQTLTGISGNGTFTTSAGPTATGAGTYHWTAVYSGDANNAGASSGCAAEPVAVASSAPSLTTTPQPATTTTGHSLNDQATLSGLVTPVTGSGAGTITFSLYGVGDTGCTTPLFTQVVTAVNGNGTYGTTGGPVAATDGTWHWTAVYGGDAHNPGASSGCSAEPVTVGAAATTTTVTSSVNPSAPGQTVTFTATVVPSPAGSITPAGSVQFVVDGVNLGSPVPLNGSGQASTTDSFATTAGSPHTVTATYIPSNGFTGSTGSLAGGQSVTTTSGCTVTNPTGSSTIRVNAGQAVCLVDTTVNGSVQVNPGGALSVTGSTINGSISSSGSGAITICGTTVHGGVTVENATAPVLIGGPSCAANNLTTGVTLSGNLDGVEIVGNQLGGRLTVTTTTGTAVIGGNTIALTLACTGNTAVSDSGQPNTVTGVRSGQCAASNF